MAIINQNPSGQTSISISTIEFDSIGISSDGTRQRRNIVENLSVELIIGSAGGSTIPTTGQIWPLGIYQ